MSDNVCVIPVIHAAGSHNVRALRTGVRENVKKKAELKYIPVICIRNRKSTGTKWFASNGKLEESVQIRIASAHAFSVQTTVAPTHIHGVYGHVVSTYAVTVHCTV